MDTNPTTPEQEIPVQQPAPAPQPEGNETPVTPQAPATPEPTPEPDERELFIQRFSDHYRKTGDVKPFLQALSTDYRGMAPEEVMRLQLREEFPQLSDERFERLYRKEVVDRFSLDADLYEEEDVEIGRQRLSKEAEKYRAKLIEKQQEFIAPAVEAQAQVDPTEEMAKMAEQWKGFVDETPFAKSLKEGKKVSFKVGDAEVNIAVDPQRVLDATYDEKLFWQTLKKGEDLDWDLWHEVMALVTDREGYRQAIFEAGKSGGSKGIVVKDLKNQQVNLPTGGVPQEPLSFNEKLKRALEQAKRK